MKIIGITGGVGAGKSLVLQYLEQKYGAYVLYADKIANDLKAPGELCYEAIVELLGKEILQSDGTIDRKKMADVIFNDKKKLEKVNEIIHPAVKAYILEQIIKKRESQDISYFVIEAALLIEEHYDEICDEMWYIYADLEIRRERLKESRGYSEEKIDSIVKGQLSEDDFRKSCQFVIDNSRQASDAYMQIDKKLGANPC